MVKFGILGCGNIANRHAEHINAHSDGQLVAAYDVSPEKTSTFCKEHNTVAMASAEALINNDELDIINICTPNGLHHLGAIEALNAGKHALVEKPMALTSTNCALMIAAAEEAKKELYIVKQNRFNPPIQKLKTLVKEQRLGEIYMVHVNCFWNRTNAYYQDSSWKGTKELDGGTLFTQFSHFIDILFYLFGDISDVQGSIANMNHKDLIEFEDSGSFSFKISTNAIGSLQYTTTSYAQNMEGSITVFAENATIKVGGKYLNTIDYQRTQGFDIEGLPESNPANNYGFYEGSMSNHDMMINNVIHALTGRGQIMTNAEEGMKVVEIIEKFYNAAK